MPGLQSLEELIKRKALFVSNIDRKAVKHDIRTDLLVVCPKEMGNIVVPVDSVDGNCMGVAFCNFNTARDAKEALHRFRFNLRVAGKPITLTYSVENKDRNKIFGAWGNRLTAVVKNLSPEVTDKMLCQKFEQFGEIFRSKVDVDKYGGKYGMVQYIHERSTRNAVEVADNKAWFSTVIKCERHAKMLPEAGEHIQSVSSGFVPVSPPPPPVSAIGHDSTTPPHSPILHRVAVHNAELSKPPPVPIQNKRPAIHQAFPALPSQRESVHVSVNAHSPPQNSMDQELNKEEKIVGPESSSLDSGTSHQHVGVDALIAAKEVKHYVEEGSEIGSTSGSNTGSAFSSTTERVLDVHVNHPVIDLMTERQKIFVSDTESKGICGEVKPRRCLMNGCVKQKGGAGFKESIAMLRNDMHAISSLMDKLERVTGALGGEGLLCCPISHEIFKDPVVAADGHTYERAEIEEWFFVKQRNSSPLTNVELPNRMLTPNVLIKSIIEELGIA